MNLKELQAMIKEELDAYVNEQEVDVDVDADDVKADGDDSMEMLRKIYDMLKPKFEDMEDMDEEMMDEEMDEEKMDEEMDEEMMDEVKDDDKKDEAIEEAPKDDEDAMEEAEDDSEESEDEAEAEDHDGGEEAAEEPEGDEDISNLSVDQFKDMIRDIISQEVGGDAPADDMDAGDIEGMGDEPAMDAEPEMAGDEEEIDLDELIGELEAISETEVEEGKKDEKEMEESADKVEEETSNQVNAESDGKDYNINRVSDLKEEATEEKSELDQALETIETLQKELNEVNILNAKLLYVNKIFKANNLTESQKVNVIAAFDKAETVKEVKLVYETVADNVGTKKETTIKEHKGSASKATGVTAKKPEVISEVSSAVQRMQKLAGIIK